MLERKEDEGQNKQHGRKNAAIGVFLDAGCNHHGVSEMAAIVDLVGGLIRKHVVMVIMEMHALGVAGFVPIQMAVNKRGEGLHGGKPDSDHPQ